MKALYCKNIYTACAADLMSGYILIDGNRIQGIVPEKEWKASMACETLDYSDGFLMPGFHDYHVHMAMAAMMEYFGTIRTAESEEAAAAILYEKNRDKNKNQWILGGAWDHFVWPDQKLPTKKSLDGYFPDTPVFSMNKECHGAWANSEALRRLNITKDTPDPPNGEYFRDENGEPTGYIHELAVAPILAKIFSEIPDEEIAEFIKAFAQGANRYGITSVGDLPLYGIIKEGAYRLLKDSGELKLRINFSVGMMETDERIAQMAEEFKGPIVTFNGVKDFVDGTPMGHTGYMVEPYSDRQAVRGKPLIPEDLLFKRVRELDEQGVRVRLHCCGDGAVRLALDAFEYAGKNNGFRDMRHAVEHIEVITPQDIPRFAELGVVASVQPEHLPRTHFAIHPFHKLIGEERLKYAWPFKSIEDTGAHMAFGTDCPVVELTPFKGLFRIVNRLTNELEPPGGFNPWEKLSLHHTLQHYTIGSAFACGRDKELGTLEAGKLADIVVLGENPFTCIHDKEAMFHMPVKMTMLDGEIVYESESF